MKKTIILLLTIAWLLPLYILIISLTDINGNNIFQHYRLITGIAFLVITGLIRFLYKKTLKFQKTSEN